MNFDLTFPHYAKRMNQYILVIAVIGAGILLAWQGWAYAFAWGLGCLFHIFFFSLMLVKFNQWQRDKREVDFIGHRLVVFTSFVGDAVRCSVGRRPIWFAVKMKRNSVRRTVAT